MRSKEEVVAAVEALRGDMRELSSRMERALRAGSGLSPHDREKEIVHLFDVAEAISSLGGDFSRFTREVEEELESWISRADKYLKAQGREPLRVRSERGA